MKTSHTIKLAVLLLIILPAAIFFIWANQELQTPVSHAQGDRYIVIPRGSTQPEIISRLSETGVIRRGWLFSLYIRLTGAAPRLKAGEYRFPSPISPIEVLRKLEVGEQRLKRLTIVEGWTRWDIAELLLRIPELNLRDKKEALALFDDTSEIRDLDPRAKNLEGYLFPDTYSFPPDTSPQEAVAMMVGRFRQVWKEALADLGGNPAVNLREIITIASLIETEAKLKEERPVIASVIYNRLKIGIPLGIDSSVIYASKLAGKWKDDGKVYLSDLERDSPYNTRKVRGLPPGPIASPGAHSIQSALAPAQTDYLYYVREPMRNDGAHNFYRDAAQFQRGVQALREWEAARDANTSIPQPQTNAPTPSP